MSNLGQLCYKYGSASLAYKAGGSALIYKAPRKEMTGDILLVVTAEQDSIGPIKSCGHFHDVTVSCLSQSKKGGIENTVPNNTASYAGTTQTGCAFPEENPHMGITVFAIQASTGITAKILKQVANVAEGEFSFKVVCDTNGKLTKVE